MTDRPAQMPPVVTFASGADLLVELKIVKSITREGVRHIANTHPLWPFGPGRAFPYWQLANAQVMETGPFLRFFRETYQRDDTG